MVLFIKSYPSGKGSSTSIIACNIHVYSIYLVITNGILVLNSTPKKKLYSKFIPSAKILIKILRTKLKILSGLNLISNL